MPPKTIIITTGTNSPTARAAAARMAAEGHQVILAGRNLNHSQQKIGGNTRIAPLNLSRRASIHQFTDWAHHHLKRVDVLIHHTADPDLSRTEREMTADGFEHTWFTHHLAPVLLTNRLMDLLIAAPQARVINRSSKSLPASPFLTVDLKDPMFNRRPYAPARAYAQSQLAQTMFTQWLARQLAGTMVTANGISTNTRLDLSHAPNLPQWIKNLYTIKALFSISPDRMAETYAYAALAPEAADRNGTCFEYPSREARIGAYEKDLLSIEQVMQLTYKQLGIAPAISFEPA